MPCRALEVHFGRAYDVATIIIMSCHLSSEQLAILPTLCLSLLLFPLRLKTSPARCVAKQAGNKRLNAGGDGDIDSFASNSSFAKESKNLLLIKMPLTCNNRRARTNILHLERKFFLPIGRQKWKASERVRRTQYLHRLVSSRSVYLSRLELVTHTHTEE